MWSKLGRIVYPDPNDMKNTNFFRKKIIKGLFLGPSKIVKKTFGHKKIYLQSGYFQALFPTTTTTTKSVNLLKGSRIKSLEECYRKVTLVKRYY